MPTTDLDFTHEFVPGPSREDAAITLLLLHGTGGNERDLLSLGRILDPQAALLSPRGKVLERGMPRFFRRLAEGVFDLEDLRTRTNELADFVIAATAVHSCDPAHVVAVGFSNGANIAASMLLLRPEVLAGAILFRPMVPLVPEKLPNLARTPVFIGAGRQDPLVAPSATDNLVTMLRAAGSTVSVQWQPGGHQLTAADAEAAHAWLAMNFHQA